MGKGEVLSSSDASQPAFKLRLRKGLEFSNWSWLIAITESERVVKLGWKLGWLGSYVVGW